LLGVLKPRITPPFLARANTYFEIPMLDTYRLYLFAHTGIQCHLNNLHLL